AARADEGDTEHQLGELPAVRAVHGGRRALRRRRIRNRLPVQGNREDAHDAAAGPDRQRAPRSAATARRAGHPRLPGWGGARVTPITPARLSKRKPSATDGRY